MARAQELVDCAAQAGVTLGVVLQHRFRPAGERLRTIIDEGRLGALVELLHVDSPVAAAELLRRARARHARA